MTGQETTSIAVCAAAAQDLDRLAAILRSVGRWSIIPIQWPDPEALAAASTVASVYVLHSGSSSVDAPSEELLALLRSRPAHIPLVVAGAAPADRASPTCWLRSPPAAVLGVVVQGLLASVDGRAPGRASAPAPSLSWRRKTDMILGSSPGITKVLRVLDQLAPAQAPVLVTGERGTGKELVARALHFGGPRARGPFVVLDCEATPESIFEAELFGYQRGAIRGAVAGHAGAVESAHNGTLFLDEIAEMPMSMQANLLRVLETSMVQRIGSTRPVKVSFRLVSATNRNLENEVREGRFREDLFHRVRVYPVHIPPLRERPEDIAPIVTHHLSAIALRENRPALRMTPAALERVIASSWPGNVRELVNLLERAALMAIDSVIDVDHVMTPEMAAQASSRTPAPGSLVPYKDAKQKFEHDYYSQLMRTAGGNVSLASKLGQKTRKEIYDALKRLGLDTDAYRTESSDSLPAAADSQPSSPRPPR